MPFVRTAFLFLKPNKIILITYIFIMKYLITSYQAVYASGARDTVKLPYPIQSDNLEATRMSLKAKHECANINLTYSEQ